MFHKRHIWDATTQNKKTNKHRSASLSDIFFLAFYEKFMLTYDLRVLLVIQLILWNPIFWKMSWRVDNVSYMSLSGLILIVSVKKTSSRFQAWLINRSDLLESVSAQDGVFQSLKAWYCSLFSWNASSFISLMDKKLNLFIVWWRHRPRRSGSQLPKDK